MPDSLPALEAERFRILRQIAALGDLRPGSICAVSRRCGKPTATPGAQASFPHGQAAHPRPAKRT